MSKEDNVAIVKKLLAATESHDVDACLSFYADDAVRDMVAEHEVVKGEEAIGKALRQVFKTFPDLHYERERNIVGCGEYVFSEMVCRATQRAPIGKHPATGKEIRLRLIHVWRLKGGKVKEMREYFDSATMLKQLGIS